MNVRIAVAGAGLIGARHADAITAAEGVSLTAIVDPAPAGGRGCRATPGASCHIAGCIV